MQVVQSLPIVFFLRLRECLFIVQGSQMCHCLTLSLYRNRGSHMSAHILLNLLNELGKKYKMRGLFNKFNKT